MSRVIALVASLVLVAFVSFSGNPVSQVSPPGADSMLSAAPEDPNLEPAELTCGMSIPSASEENSQYLETAACSRCPDGSPQCWGDKQCDTFCGGKGLGACVRINSCYKCCSCYAFF